MTDYTLDDRLIENRAAWTDYWKTFTIERFGAVLAVIALVVAVAGYINQHGGLLNLTNILGDFYANVSSELISIVITVLVVDRLNRAREQRDNEALQTRLDEQELSRLKALLGSNENVVTKIAVAELSAKGWLEDGSLKAINLENANLQGVDMGKANLQEAYMGEVNLQEAYLQEANLQFANLVEANLSAINLGYANLRGINLADSNLSGARLWNVNLSDARLRKANIKDADLSETNLYGTNLRYANLHGAHLWYTNLQMADLSFANLKYANVYGVICNEKTTLPDGTQWTPEINWSNYGAVEIENWDDWQAYRKEHGLDKPSE